MKLCMKALPLLLPLLSSLCVVTSTAAATTNYATAAVGRERPRRPQNATNIKAPIAAEASYTSNSSSSRGNRARSGGSDAVAQHKLLMPLPASANQAVQSIAGRSDVIQSRRRTQIATRRKPNSTSSTTTTTTTTSTTTTTTSTTTTPRPSLANAFNFFTPNFWSFGQQSLVALSTKPPTGSAPTKHPPKKFTHSTTSSAKEEKLNYRKQTKTTYKPLRSSTTTTTTTTSVRPTTDGPFRIALPAFTFPNAAKAVQSSSNDKDKDKRATKDLRKRFNCPRENEVRFQLFPKICKTDKDCAVWQRDEICCDIFGASSCVMGKPKPLEETPHAPILGLIPRKCPTRPLAELWWDVQECQTDMDCWPRVCCPDGRRRYCRSSQPELETVPVPVKRSFNYLTEYLECTAPPPTIFDLHPKACTSTLDCFPNVCCQEAGLRHCRPPKKSVLTLMANFLNVDFVKRLTQNIVIK